MIRYGSIDSYINSKCCGYIIIDDIFGGRKEVMIHYSFFRKPVLKDGKIFWDLVMHQMFQCPKKGDKVYLGEIGRITDGYYAKAWTLESECDDDTIKYFMAKV